MDDAKTRPLLALRGITNRFQDPVANNIDLDIHGGSGVNDNLSS